VKRRYCYRVIALVWISLGIARAQVTGEGYGSVSVRTDVDSALVVIDGSFVGRTPLPGHPLPSGSHVIRVLHPDVENWLSPVLEDSVLIVAGEEISLEYTLGTTFLVRSEPSGASVFLGGQLAGTTPLVLDVPETDSVLQIRLKDHAAASVNRSDHERGVLLARLNRTSEGTSGPENIVKESPSPSTLPLVLTGASSILAGGFSAYFKVKADSRYSEYLATGDPVKRAETRRLDSIAGISLAASQVYLALFIYLLVSS
jgi:hypothetical protein